MSLRNIFLCLSLFSPSRIRRVENCITILTWGSNIRICFTTLFHQLDLHEAWKYWLDLFIKTILHALTWNSKSICFICDFLTCGVSHVTVPDHVKFHIHIFRMWKMTFWIAEIIQSHVIILHVECHMWNIWYTSVFHIWKKSRIWFRIFTCETLGLINQSDRYIAPI